MTGVPAHRDPWVSEPFDQYTRETLVSLEAAMLRLLNGCKYGEPLADMHCANYAAKRPDMLDRTTFTDEAPPGKPCPRLAAL